MAETMIANLQLHICELEDKIKAQQEEISELKNLIELIRADAPDQKEFDE